MDLSEKDFKVKKSEEINIFSLENSGQGHLDENQLPDLYQPTPQLNFGDIMKEYIMMEESLCSESSMKALSTSSKEGTSEIVTNQSDFKSRIANWNMNNFQDEQNSQKLYGDIDNNINFATLENQNQNKRKKRKINDNSYQESHQVIKMKEELLKIYNSQLTEEQKKEACSKIKNRISAQQSRDRQKAQFQEIQQENQMLKQENQLLKQEIILLKKENQFLKKKQNQDAVLKQNMMQIRTLAQAALLMVVTIICCFYFNPYDEKLGSATNKLHRELQTISILKQNQQQAEYLQPGKFQNLSSELQKIMGLELELRQNQYANYYCELTDFNDKPNIENVHYPTILILQNSTYDSQNENKWLNKWFFDKTEHQIKYQL